MPDEIENADMARFAELRARADALEEQLTRVRQDADTRLIRSELRAEAGRAGMLDLDGLKLADLTGVKLGEDGEVEGASAVMTKLKRDKPWLFGAASSSIALSPPPASPPRHKRATEMSEVEYRAARAELLKRRY